MPAPTHTRSHRPSAHGVDIRLPWWAVVLPALAFAALLLLMAGPGQAAASAGEPGVGHVVIQIQQTLSR
ncbi:hypothetical protein P3L51_16680 [Streptomyces sp. PSRA5]|uniref:hypothetical protein n=1 Tax=Streptomyces panacea TaxID=3035064 RepID=UPI00339C2BF7